MASFVILGVILFILTGVANCPPPYSFDERISMANEAVKGVCDAKHFENFIKCEMIPGRFVE